MSESSNIELLPLHNRKSKTPSRAVTPSQGTLQPKPSETLPIQDRPQFIILVILYLLQGIPVGLSFGSVPFLLKSKLSYSQVAVFSLAAYPYSLKLLWSPVVDAIYNPKIGRRKSWIIPIQFISGFTLIYLGNSMDQLLENPEENLIAIAWTFFMLVFLCATQDIAVDGWALTILSPNALSYASTAQTIGLNTGYFLSFTVFLAFNSENFSNKYLRSVPQTGGVLSLNNYLTVCGVIYIVVTCLVAVFVDEEPHHLKKVKKADIIETTNTNKNVLQSLKTVYHSMFQVLKLSNIQSFIIIHLISKIGFQANEGATNLKLLEKGFGREDLAITVLIDFPFEIIFGYYVAKWSSGKGSLNPWLYAYLGRLFSAFLASIVIYSFPADGKVNTFYFICVILQHLLGSFMSTIQFVSINAFHTQISDPLIGGTYMTTLNTLSNLGGQWPRFIVLQLIDVFTNAICVFDNDGLNFNVTNEHLKETCKADGGVYTILRDGYYVTNFLCIVIGLVLYFTFIKRKVQYLQTLPTAQWRVKEI